MLVMILEGGRRLWMAEVGVGRDVSSSSSRRVGKRDDSDDACDR